ncbi:MAG: citrate/2-methylcitrate synthase [Clostridia bacterium]|nr:citrate/2-methylcitrate synthase [Clostridia bacterium]
MPSLESLCEEYKKNNHIDAADFVKHDVKRGLRNADGSGVVAGLTRICNVHGYLISDGERIPDEGELIYRGVNVKDIIDGCVKDNRFGFEEVVWLLLFGELPSADKLQGFRDLIAECRALPDDFAEDMIIKAPSPNIMNKLARSVLALYSYDDNPDDTSIPNILRQSIELIARLPTIMVYAYQVKRRHYDNQTMFLHPIDKKLSTAEFILSCLRPDQSYTEEESKLLDTCLILHAEHGGGNNSTFTTRVLSSSGTDTYSAIAGAIGSLKGPRHGGANIKVTEMLFHIKAGVSNPNDDGEIKDFIAKLIRKEAGDKSGLVYGMGHAVYTLSDPRSRILHDRAKNVAIAKGFETDFKILEAVERLTPEVFAEIKGSFKPLCSNVDLYSGLVYRALGIPDDLFTPIFAVSRSAGWSAHRVEEFVSGGRIIRPAYKAVAKRREYVSLDER